MKRKLNEGLPAAVPTFPVEVAGQHLTLRFDTNINKTKKGVKLQFVLGNVPEDPRELQNLANKIGAELQTMFGESGLQIVYDVENPYTNVIGFLLPLPSIATYIKSHVLKAAVPAEPETAEPEEDEEKPEELPAKEEPPAGEEPKKMAEHISLRKLLLQKL